MAVEKRFRSWPAANGSSKKKLLRRIWAWSWRRDGVAPPACSSAAHRGWCMRCVTEIIH